MGLVMTELLTEVDLLWLEGRIERWVRFGHAVEERIVDRRQRVLTFAPDTVFAFRRSRPSMRWRRSASSPATLHRTTGDT